MPCISHDSKWHLVSFQLTGLVVNSINVETASCTSSTASEKEAFKTVLAEAKSIFREQLKVILYGRPPRYRSLHEGV